MSKKSEKTYVIRGFDVFENFGQPTGTIEDKDTFQEVVVKTQAEAIVTILTDPVICSMVIASQDPKDVLHITDLNIVLNLTDKLEVRAVKTTLRDIFCLWAEKSRVKNRRGFRASAIRTPEFVYNQYGTNVKVQVILSNAIIYSDTLAETLDESDILSDLKLLKKELTKRLDWKFNRLSYNHSVIGKGSL
jgi:hypothetical protein